MLTVIEEVVMSTSQAVSDLVREHEAIVFALGILERISEQLAAGKAVAVDDLAQFIEFFKEFADTCHHGKEEQILFPALLDAGGPGERAHITAMLTEHDEGRGLIADMKASLQPALDAKKFVAAARAYSALLQSHIAKENGVLFPMAERILEPAQSTRLFAEFEEYETRVMGAGRHEQLHGLLKALRAKYPARGPTQENRSEHS
jgi:hemerythrin-like domain-containing protein